MANDRSRQAPSWLGLCVSALLSCFAVATSATLAAEPLALKRVTLSTGGVGYFEYEATVDGDVELSLPVRLDQVDDVLKSIVVHDDRGGTGRIRLPGREPLGQIFREFPFGPDAFDSPAALLNALQGAEVLVQGARQLQGRLLRVVPEAVQLPDGLGTTTRHRVSLMTDQGFQQFILEDAESVQFVDAELKAQVEAALTGIAVHRARDRRVLKVTASGQGRRTLRVGFVVSVPLWKASYRLTLPPDAGAAAEPRALLQGWAVVENVSGQDWENIELTLVSGNPVTFRQALYTAYFVDRPEVPVEVLGRILPRPDEGVIAGTGARADLQRDLEGKAFRKAAAGLLAEEMVAAPSVELSLREEAPDVADAALAAQAEEAATQVVFRFSEPVSVRTGHSLLVPIIDREMPAERLALYQPETHSRHPLSTVRLTNDGETGLPPGVLTLYERAGPGAASYLGDARLSVVPAGEERLVSFALDQKMRIDRETKSQQTISKGRINRGILELTLVDEQSTIYRLKAPPREDRLVLIAHPRQPGWTLTAPAEKDTELTAEHYRVRHQLRQGGEDRLEVTLERPRFQKIELIDVSTAQLARYARMGELDEALRQAFATMGELRAEIDRHGRRLHELGRKREQIFEEQKRIRENLVRVPQNSDLYRRYLGKLDAQEDELERLLSAIDRAQEELNRAGEALSDYIGGLQL